ncbi:MAG: N-acetylmuramoyl-L-alanine amidase [Actinomycetota bacterium]
MVRRIGSVALAVGFLIALLPLPALGRGAPKTLADVSRLGMLGGGAAPVDPDFPIDYVGLSWVSGGEPSIRFRHGERWGPWDHAHVDDIPRTAGRTFSRLVYGADADAFQVRGRNVDVRVTAINTTDGPRPFVWETPEAGASHILQPPIVSRAEWGANESLRFDKDGKEKCRRTFHPTQKLIVHHTVTANDDPDPAATVRAIYRFHTIDRGWCDIGYNFLVDAEGRIYKGRYSGPHGTKHQDTPTGENATGEGVTGAHVGGFNSGTMGIAVLGDYRTVDITDATHDALVEHLAWEAERHGIDPRGSSSYVNPVNGETKKNPNISGHLDWGPTECPGTFLYGRLPQIREDTGDRVGDGPLCPEGAICGTEGDDELLGTPGDDVIHAYGGDDTIRAFGGDDTIFAGPGADLVVAGAGGDVVSGGGGRDEIRGGRGPDVLQGNRGHDTLRGGRGRDNLRGGGGTDTCRGGPGRDRVRGCEA